jgi:zinc transporter ZupT
MYEHISAGSLNPFKAAALVFLIIAIFITAALKHKSPLAKRVHILLNKDGNAKKAIAWTSFGIALILFGTLTIIDELSK